MGRTIAANSLRVAGEKLRGMKKFLPGMKILPAGAKTVRDGCALMLFFGDISNDF